MGEAVTSFIKSLISPTLIHCVNLLKFAVRPTGFRRMRPAQAFFLVAK
jgi:hypothetical protein